MLFFRKIMQKRDFTLFLMWSRDCNLWMKFTLYNSHKISQTTFAGESTPGEYSMACQIIGPIKPLHFSTPGHTSEFGSTIFKLSWQWHTALVSPSPFSRLLRSIDKKVCQDWFKKARDGSPATHMNQILWTQSQDSIYFAEVTGCMKRLG